MEFMEQRSLDDLEAGVDRLLAAFEQVKSENRQLREQIATMEQRQNLFKERLDSMLARLEGLDLQ
jgi:cell division septum initiation protein DivIVA